MREIRHCLHLVKSINKPWYGNPTIIFNMASEGDDNMKTTKTTKRFMDNIDHVLTYLKDSTYPAGFSRTQKKELRRKTQNFCIREGVFYYKHRGKIFSKCYSISWELKITNLYFIICKIRYQIYKTCIVDYIKRSSTLSNKTKTFVFNFEKK